MQETLPALLGISQWLWEKHDTDNWFWALRSQLCQPPSLLHSCSQGCLQAFTAPLASAEMLKCQQNPRSELPKQAPTGPRDWLRLRFQQSSPGGRGSPRLLSLKDLLVTRLCEASAAPQKASPYPAHVLSTPQHWCPKEQLSPPSPVGLEPHCLLGPD